MKPVVPQKPNDKLLDRLEESINRLKLDYDIFFNGGSDILPFEQHEALNAEVKRLFNLQLLSYAQNFRLNSLASRLNVYNELWQKNLKLMEQGKKAIFGVRQEMQPLRKVEVPMTTESDRESIDILYQAYCRARERTGNDTPVDPVRFEELVANQLKEVKAKKACDQVIFVVSVENGRAFLKTRANK
jgi:hypothetical protein